MSIIQTPWPLTAQPKIHPSSINTSPSNEDHPFRKREFKPEQLLLAAILQRAITDITEIRASICEWDRISAARWLTSTSNKPFSFLWTCEHLKLYPPQILKLANNHTNLAALAAQRPKRMPKLT